MSREQVARAVQAHSMELCNWRDHSSHDFALVLDRIRAIIDAEVPNDDTAALIAEIREALA